MISRMNSSGDNVQHAKLTKATLSGHRKQSAKIKLMPNIGEQATTSHDTVMTVVV